jgi:hypothetical protein
LRESHATVRIQLCDGFGLVAISTHKAKGRVFIFFANTTNNNNKNNKAHTFEKSI